MATFESLKSNTAFRTLYYRGKSQVHPALVTYVRHNPLGVPRVGITTGKKIGKAVQRNRCRRVIREAFRMQSPPITGGVDIVFVARTRTLSMKSTDLAVIMTRHLHALGVTAE